MDKATLKSLNIAEWSDVESNFIKADVLLGNGFSINLCSQFNYTTLFAEFMSCCTPAEQAIFGAFGTTNFEFIMQDLLGAIKVNQIFGTPNPDIINSLDRLRDGLIKAIHSVHPQVGPSWSAVAWSRLEKISADLQPLGDIYSLNYDTLFYNILMITKDRHASDSSVSPYNDYYWSPYSADWLQFMDFQNLKHYKHVYYLTLRSLDLVNWLRAYFHHAHSRFSLAGFIHDVPPGVQWSCHRDRSCRAGSRGFSRSGHTPAIASVVW